MPTDAPQLPLFPVSVPGPATNPAQKRFGTLIKQIAQSRTKLASWTDHVGTHRMAHARAVRPLQDALVAGLRTWLFALDAAFDEKGWTQVERETMTAMICKLAGDMLDANANDDGLKAMFEKHAQVDYATARLQALRTSKAMAEQMTGLDLGDEDDLLSEQDLHARLREGLRAQADAELEAKAAKAAKRKKKAGRQAPEPKPAQAEAADATQSLRDVFRKLASALHPDREPDATQREAKTALMQRANQAYANKDLLTLLELQLQIEQIDASHLAGASEQKLDHYNQVLAAQLKELQSELQRVEREFRAEFDIPRHVRLEPRQLDATIAQEGQQLRSELTQQQKDIALLYDRAATKRWLKQQRAMMA